MDLLTLFFWFTVASAIIFQVLGERGIVKVGCGTLVYIYLGLLVVVILIQQFGSRDPNSLFVRKNLVIAAQVQYKLASEKDLKKGLLIAKGINFASSKDVEPYEIIFRSESGKEKQVFLEPDYALRFGTTRSTYDYDGKEYIIRMDTYMTNQFHENYYRPETDLRQLTKFRDYYEKRYE
jgi:hypothetical protein